MTQEEVDAEDRAIDRERARDEAKQERRRQEELAQVNKALAARGLPPVTYSA